MGQKVNPTGLRVGSFRKWNTTWFAEKNHSKAIFYAQYQLEQFLKSYFHFYSYTKNSASKRATLVDLKWFRAGMHQLYFFIFFYKFRTKKRRWGIRYTYKKRKRTVKLPTLYWVHALRQDRNRKKFESLQAHRRFQLFNLFPKIFTYKANLQLILRSILSRKLRRQNEKNKSTR